MKIYLAGKIALGDWRHDVVKGLRGAWPEDPNEATYEPWPVLEGSIFGLHDYVGPYFISCDHGCAHGPSTHGTGTDGSPEPAFEGGALPGLTRHAVASSCWEAIQKCDLFFAWLDDPTAYGTLVELGLAHSILTDYKNGIPILRWDTNIVVAMNREIYDAGDMWFAAEHSLLPVCVYPDPITALQDTIFRIEGRT